jgi:hypothetical protein
MDNGHASEYALGELLAQLVNAPAVDTYMCQPWDDVNIFGTFHLGTEGGNHEILGTVQIHAHFDDHN